MLLATASTAQAAERPQNDTLSAVLSEEMQDHIFALAQARYPDPQDEAVLKTYYASLIGLAEGESEFKQNATNHNSGGTTDRGMFQINSSNVKSLKKLGFITQADDLYDPYISAICGEYMFWQGWQRYGFSEWSYAQYLYGKPHKPNKKTARVWNKMVKWNDTLWKEQE